MIQICLPLHLHASEVTSPCILQPNNGESASDLSGDVKKLMECLHDSMTECVYHHPITSVPVEAKPQLVFEVDILGKGRAALETANDDLGENFDTFPASSRLPP